MIDRAKNRRTEPKIIIRNMVILTNISAKIRPTIKSSELYRLLLNNFIIKALS